MKQVRYLRIDFNDAIEGRQLPALRGALARKAGWEYSHFHNHKAGEEGGYHHRYPLIQYKCCRGKPVLIGLGEGVDEAHMLFHKQGEGTIFRDGTELSLAIERMQMEQYRIGIWKNLYPYKLRNWIPLRGETYKEYQRAQGLIAKSEILQRILRNQFVGLMYSFGIEPDQQIEVILDGFDPPQWVKLKDMRLMAFHVRFRCNLILPELIGIGKGSSIGYGVLTRWRLKKEAS